jgi:PAS domain S-box-containing protein
MEGGQGMAKARKQLLQKMDPPQQRVQESDKPATGRMVTPKQLKSSGKNNHDILDDMLEGCQIIGYDWRYLYVNAAVVKHSRKSREKLLGHTMMEVYPGIENTAMFAALRECMEKRTFQLMDNEFVFPDGSKGWFELRIEPVNEGILVLSVDVTERRQAENRLRQAAEEWRRTFDSITDGVSILDNHARLLKVNRAFADIFKKKPQELIGKVCCELIHGTATPIHGCPHQITLQMGKAAQLEVFEPNLGIYLDVSTSPIFDDSGRVSGSVHICRDITERKHMEEKLLTTDRLSSVGELASGIAHELNNPLTGVIGLSELLLKSDVPDAVREDLEVIFSEAQRAAQVVKNLLTFTRKHPQVRQMLNINDVIHKVLHLRAYEEKVNNIEVVTCLASDLPEISADYFQLQQVFLNIVINAEYFMLETHNRGKLVITTERAGDYVRASFADDGSGISKEHMRHLFDPFFTTKEVGKGTGLGLSICHGIVTAHGGNIYARSEPGQGATFVVELPVRGNGGDSTSKLLN